MTHPKFVSIFPIKVDHEDGMYDIYVFALTEDGRVFESWWDRAGNSGYRPFAKEDEE